MDSNAKQKVKKESRTPGRASPGGVDRVVPTRSWLAADKGKAKLPRPRFLPIAEVRFGLSDDRVAIPANVSPPWT